MHDSTAPNTSPRNSEAPLAIFGCAVKPGSEATKTMTLTTRLMAETALPGGQGVQPALPGGGVPRLLGHGPAELAGRHQLTVLHGQLSGGEHAVAVTHGGLVDHHGRHHVRDCDAELGQLGFMPGAICTTSQPGAEVSMICFAACVRIGAVRCSHLVMGDPTAGRRRPGLPVRGDPPSAGRASRRAPASPPSR